MYSHAAITTYQYAVVQHTVLINPEGDEELHMIPMQELKLHVHVKLMVKLMLYRCCICVSSARNMDTTRTVGMLNTHIR